MGSAQRAVHEAADWRVVAKYAAEEGDRDAECAALLYAIYQLLRALVGMTGLDIE